MYYTFYSVDNTFFTFQRDLTNPNNLSPFVVQCFLVKYLLDNRMIRTRSAHVLQHLSVPLHQHQLIKI